MKADSSRAIAVATTVGRLPFRVSDRKRPHNLICAFQAIHSLLHSPLPVSLFDDREQILAMSQSWLEQSGYLREELRRLWTIRAYGERSGEVLSKSAGSYSFQQSRRRGR